MTLKIANEIEDYLCTVGNLKGYYYTRKESQDIVSSLLAFMIEKQYSIMELREEREDYISKASEIYLGLLNITTRMEDIEDNSSAIFCQLETASKRTKYLNEELQKIHIDSVNSVMKKIISLLDEQYSFEESKLGVFGHDSSIGKCAQSRIHLIEKLKLKIKEHMGKESTNLTENKLINKVGVVAGNYKQYKNFVCINKLNPEKYFYVESINKLIGRRDIKVFFYGSCRDRKDYEKIYEYIMSHDIEVATTL